MAAHGRRTTWAVLRGEIAELLLPQRCVACREFGSALHAECLEGLPRADGPRCERCWAPLGKSAGRGALCGRCTGAVETGIPAALEARRAPFRFEGAARLAILEAKFRDVTALLAPLSQAAAGAVDEAWGIGAVVPVPLHPARRRRRGFDQGALIASTVATRLGTRVRADLIRRTRETKPQASLGRAERARNVAGAFAPCEAGGADAPPARALLVDDVATTGATLEAAALALRAAGVARVFGLTLTVED